jgi:hypothetical protein
MEESVYKFQIIFIPLHLGNIAICHYCESNIVGNEKVKCVTVLKLGKGEDTKHTYFTTTTG